MQQIGETGRVIRALEIAIEVAPERRRAYWRLAETLAADGRIDAAFEALSSAIALGGVDYDRLVADPSWNALRERPEWAGILDEARANRR